MFQDLKGPLGVKGVIQPMNYCVTLHVIQCFAKFAGLMVNGLWQIKTACGGFQSVSVFHQLIYPLYYLDVLVRKSSVLGVTDFDFLNVRQVPVAPVSQLMFLNSCQI